MFLHLFTTASIGTRTPNLLVTFARASYNTYYRHNVRVSAGWYWNRRNKKTNVKGNARKIVPVFAFPWREGTCMCICRSSVVRPRQRRALKGSPLLNTQRLVPGPSQDRPGSTVRNCRSASEPVSCAAGGPKFPGQPPGCSQTFTLRNPQHGRRTIAAMKSES